MTVESCDFPRWNGTSWPSDVRLKQLITSILRRVNGSEYATANMQTGMNVHCRLTLESLGGGEVRYGRKGNDCPGAHALWQRAHC